MKLSEIGSPKGANKKSKRRGLGQGSGHGKTSCRGQKGQMCRSGRGTYIGFEGGQMPLMRRIPKRGFNNPFNSKYQIVNLTQLNIFKSDEIIDLAILETKGLIKNKNKLVKILGEGEIKKALTIKAHKFSKSAIKKIQESGGKIEHI